ncbi:sphingosine kinase B-like [Tribolium madens]|uniref:sphingosine kinase B-like n=1 Tax=Tribolium madens TaxID=41895 RepID=UPI001CF744D0|nr:sphingosine kinase B-like [Tribolium madens]
MWLWLPIFVVLFLHIQCEPTELSHTTLDESHDDLETNTTEKIFSGDSEEIVNKPTNPGKVTIIDEIYFIEENKTKIQNETTADGHNISNKDNLKDGAVDDKMKKVHENDDKLKSDNKNVEDKSLTILENKTIFVNTTTSLTSSSSSFSTSSSTSSFSTSTSTTESSVSITTSETTSFEEENNNYDLIFKGFNWNYLFYLFLLVPATGIPIGLYYYCKKRKKKNHNNEKRSLGKNRRFSTPSWVFSEPDFIDEEVITLEEEKNK